MNLFFDYFAININIFSKILERIINKKLNNIKNNKLKININNFILNQEQVLLFS